MHDSSSLDRNMLITIVSNDAGDLLYQRETSQSIGVSDLIDMGAGRYTFVNDRAVEIRVNQDTGDLQALDEVGVLYQAVELGQVARRYDCLTIDTRDR